MSSVRSECKSFCLEELGVHHLHLDVHPLGNPFEPYFLIFVRPNVYRYDQLLPYAQSLSLSQDRGAKA